MKKYALYPFYTSIRFRLGLLFNVLLLIFLSGVMLLLYNNVKKDLEQGFERRLSLGANIILQKTDVSPMTVPLPQTGEFFLITYNNKITTDTLFNDIPFPVKRINEDSIYRSGSWWGVRSEKKLETGGIVSIFYVLPAIDFNKSMAGIKTLLFIYIPASIVIAFISGFFLSGVFLKPLRNIINKANRIDLSNDIKLLDEPPVKDELHEMTDAINRMLLRIKKQSQQQNNFFASASHELRTPLSNMMTELQTAELTGMPSEIKALIANQLAEVKRLRDLVNNFLWMSQLKSGHAASYKSSFSIVDVCIESIEAQRLYAGQKFQSFKIDLYPPEADFLLFADKHELTVALNNLISNAVKYGLTGSTINLAIVREEQLIIRIENKTQSEIKDANALKNEFERGNGSQEGFGLGLWIAEQLIVRNAGTLNLQCINGVFVSEIRLG